MDYLCSVLQYPGIHKLVKLRDDQSFLCLISTGTLRSPPHYSHLAFSPNTAFVHTEIQCIDFIFERFALEGE